MNDTVSTEPAARSNSLLIRVGACVASGRSVDLVACRQLHSNSHRHDDGKYQEHGRFLHLTSLFAVFHWRAIPLIHVSVGSEEGSAVPEPIYS